MTAADERKAGRSRARSLLDFPKSVIPAIGGLALSLMLLPSAASAAGRREFVP